MRSLVSSDAALCKIVGFPATTLGTAAAAASPSAFGARTYSRARANTDANGSYSYPLRQPLIFQLHYQGIGSVRFLMDRLRDTGKQLKKLKDYFLARVVRSLPPLAVSVGLAVVESVLAQRHWLILTHTCICVCRKARRNLSRLLMRVD